MLRVRFPSVEQGCVFAQGFRQAVRFAIAAFEPLEQGDHRESVAVRVLGRPRVVIAVHDGLGHDRAFFDGPRHQD